MSYAHLHCHTHYSLLDSINKPHELFAKAKVLGIPALAITEHGNMHSAVKCAKLAKTTGVKWIPGLEAYFRPTIREKTRLNHVTLLGISNEGYKNLCRLSTRGFTEGFYRKPNVDFEMLAEHSEGIVCFSGCMSGLIPRLLDQNKDEKAEKWIKTYLDIFGDRFFMEVWNHRMPEQRRLVPRLVKLARKGNIPLIATGDCHYTEKDHYDAHSVLKAIDYRKSPEESGYPTEHFELKSPEEMRKLWQALPEACDNTLLVSDWCDFELDISTKHAPIYQEDGVDDNCQRFRELVLEGFKQKYGKKPTASHLDRVKYEVATIEKLGYQDYFLIVWDLIRYARGEGIPVGPGRGSAAGSMVAYCLDITRLDPMEHGLLFERFLNPDRVSDPDIDIDFCKDRRAEVIQYLRDRYGPENVARIVTFSAYHGRGAVKDVGRAIGLDYENVHTFARTIPQNEPFDVEGILREPPEIARTIPKFKRLVEAAGALQEVLRHRSSHAAGVLIGDQPLIDLIPLCTDKHAGLVSQYSMEDAEEVGLLKIDILGLETLTVMERCLKMIPEDRRPDLDAIIAEGKFEDNKTWQVFQQAQTAGLFQVESLGMRQILYESNPCCLEDMTAAVALYRPGPLDAGTVREYIDRKNGKTPITYLHEKLEPILKNTYGIIVYQEQIMQLAVELCGYTLPEADSLRKVIGKKQLDKVAKEGKRFVHHAVEISGLDEALVTELWRQIETFGRYGFNKTMAEGTEVLTLNGVMPIESITHTDQVLTIEEESGEIVLSKVVTVHDHGVLPMYEIEFDDGSIVTCTLDHKFMTDKGQVPIYEIKKDNLSVWGTISIEDSMEKTFQELPYTFRGIEKEQKSRGSQEPKRSQQVLEGTPRRTASNSKESSTNSSDKSKSYQGSPGKHDNLEQVKSRSKNSIRHSQENLSKTIHSNAKSQKAQELERQEPRSVQENSREGMAVTKTIESRKCHGTTLVKNDKVMPSYDKNISKTSRLWLPGKEITSGNRRTLAFHPNQGRRISTESPRKGQTTRYSCNGTQMDSSEALYRFIQSKNRTTNVRCIQLDEINRNKKRSILLRKIVRIHSVGPVQGYDLEVNHPDHNFLLANGLCTSNSHAASYALITYLTAYLKAHHHREFMASLLTSAIGDSEKFQKYVYECVQRMRLRVMPPNINKSDQGCTVENGHIRCGLMAIKGIAHAAANDIVAHRGNGYKNMEDLVGRATKTNKATVRGLIESGALDNIIPNRRSAIEVLPDIMKQKRLNVVSLFNQVTEIEELDEYTNSEMRGKQASVLQMPVLKARKK